MTIKQAITTTQMFFASAALGRGSGSGLGSGFTHLSPDLTKPSMHASQVSALLQVAQSSLQLAH
jgi:hypothetical protein